MDYYCEVCDFLIKLKSKYNHFKTNIHKEIDKCKNKKLSFENPHINNIDKAFYAYIIQHNKKTEYYLVKCDFKSVFKEYQYCPYVTSKLSDKKTMCSWQVLL